MNVGSLVAGLLFAAVIIGGGLAMLLTPGRLRDVGLKMTESQRNWPVLGYFRYEALRKPSSILQLRLGGLVALLTGLLVLFLQLRYAALTLPP